MRHKKMLKQDLAASTVLASRCYRRAPSQLQHETALPMLNVDRKPVAFGMNSSPVSFAWASKLLTGELLYEHIHSDHSPTPDPANFYLPPNQLLIPLLAFEASFSTLLSNLSMAPLRSLPAFWLSSLAFASASENLAFASADCVVSMLWTPRRTRANSQLDRTCFQLG